MAIAAAILKNGINPIITNMTGTMVGVIIPDVILTTVGRCTVSSPNFTSDITLADRTETGTDTDNGVIDPSPVTVTPDGITGDITGGITTGQQFTTITAAKTSSMLRQVFRTAVSRYLSG